MLLKVGELARQTGLTVRTLHHYDAIGLLKPSGRSDAGYRLYNQADVARLHGIQALRHLGLPLSDIDSMLAEGGKSLSSIISRQIQALDHDMAKAAEIRGRLILMQDRFSSGSQPAMSEWLTTLALMATYGKYFTATELKSILAKWTQMEAEWQPLIIAIRQAMDKSMASDSVEVQSLARRWMELSLRWMEGDFDLLARWSDMCRKEPVAYGTSGIDADVFEFIGKAIGLRLAALEKYLRPEDWKRLKVVPEKEWITLNETAERLIREGASVESEQAQILARQWSGMIDHVTNGDPVIREKLLTAIRNEPLLQAGMAINDKARDFIRRAYQAAMP